MSGHPPANAALIVPAAGNDDSYWPIINDLISALELCLKGDALTWEVEQEADVTLTRARQMIWDRVDESAGSGI